MSENLKALDEFPTFTGEESPQEQIRQLQNYLYVVKEQLRYALSNLSEKNLNPTAWAAMQKQTLDSQTQEAAFNKLTNNGAMLGIFMEDGQLYINASYLKSGMVDALLVKTGMLSDKEGKNFWNLDTGEFRLSATAQYGDGTLGDAMEDAGRDAVDAQTQEEVFNKLTNNKESDAIALINGQLYINASRINSGILSAGNASGETFYVNTETGEVRINAKSLSIGGVGAASEEYADEAVEDFDNTLTQAEVLKRLTNDGILPGIYMEDGQLYINASYLKSGTVKAELIDVENLVAKKVRTDSTSGANVIVEGNRVAASNNDGSVRLSYITGGTEGDFNYGEVGAMFWGKYQHPTQAKQMYFNGEKFVAFTGDPEEEDKYHEAGLFFDNADGVWCMVVEKLIVGGCVCHWEYIPEIGKTMLVTDDE